MKGLYSTGATDLKSIFQAPLEAVITADIEMAEKITNFIARYGFEKNIEDEDEEGEIKSKGDNFGKLRMVTFSFMNNKGKMEKCKIPVLSLIQLPLLCIKNADFNMKVKMITTDEDPGPPTPPSLTGGAAAKAPAPKNKVLKAYLSPDSDQINESIKANMKVNLSMGPSDMPGGLLKILAMMNDITEFKKNDYE
jgi:Protein of unknown function (DUF2589)